MSVKETLEKLTELAEGVARRAGFVLVDVRFGQLGRKRTLEVTIFKPEGPVGLDDCQALSRSLESELEALSPPVVEGSFLLAVQSPGIERELRTDREFAVFAGHTVQVRLRQAAAGLGDTFHGTLLGKAGDRILVGNPVADRQAGRNGPAARPTAGEPAPEKLEIELAKIARVRLFPAAGKSAGPSGKMEHQFTGNH